MHNFARHRTTGKERSLRFVREMLAAARQRLPECPPMVDPISAPEARHWRTVRVRPEVAAVIDCLQERSARHGPGLTVSEVLAALVLNGLPEVTASAPFTE